MSCGGVGVDHVGDLEHLALLHQELDHVDGALGHAVGEFLDGDRLGHHDLADDLLLRLVTPLAASARCVRRRNAATRALALVLASKRGGEREPAAAASASPVARRFGRRRPGALLGAGVGDGARRVLLLGSRLGRAAGPAARWRPRALADGAFLATSSALRLASSLVRRRSSSSRLRASAAARSARSRGLALGADARLFLGVLAVLLLAHAASASACGARLALVLGQGAQHDAGRLRAGGGRRRRCAGAAGAAAAAALAARARPGRRRGLRALSRPRGLPGRCAALDFSTTTALVRPWEKLWRTIPCSMPRRFSVSVLRRRTLSVLSPVLFVSAHSRS